MRGGSAGSGGVVDTALDRCTDSNSLIGVETLAGVTTKDRLDGLDDVGQTRRATDENDLIDFAGFIAWKARASSKDCTANYDVIPPIRQRNNLSWMPHLCLTNGERRSSRPTRQ